MRTRQKQRVEKHHWNTGAKENQQLNPGGPSNRQKKKKKKKKRKRLNLYDKMKKKNSCQI